MSSLDNAQKHKSRCPSGKSITSSSSSSIQWRIQDIEKGGPNQMSGSGGLKSLSGVWGSAPAAGAFYLF